MKTAHKGERKAAGDFPNSPTGRARTALIVVLLGVGVLLVFSSIKTKLSRPSVIIYCAQDQEYAEPILAEFTQQTGIEVKPVFDNEAVKTVGLANRFLAEKSHPQCDVFWGNEELRTRQLAAEGVFRETNGVATFGFRSRRLVINTNHVSPERIPVTLAELTNAVWKGKIALAYPMFGTTAAHFLALRQHWGAARWRDWCRALAANRPFLVDGNSVVVKLVGRGEAWLGLTDSDDIAAGQREGLPIVAGPLLAEALLIPNTVGLTRNAPHPQAATALYEYLQTPAVAEQLVKANALEAGPGKGAPGLEVQWDGVLKDLEPATAEMKEMFLR